MTQNEREVWNSNIQDIQTKLSGIRRDMNHIEVKHIIILDKKSTDQAASAE